MFSTLIKRTTNLLTKRYYYGGMTCGDVIYNNLEKKNVKHVFMLSGGAIMPIIDSWYNKDTIKNIIGTHEQNLGHAATGYAKSSKNTGVIIVTSGPGLTNLVTPILDAKNDSTPLVVITGQVSKKAMGKLSFQECPATEITQHITKWSYCIQTIEEVPLVLDIAFKIANDGKKGPVHIDLPKCIASSIYPNNVENNFEELRNIEAKYVHKVKKLPIGSKVIQNIAKAINTSKNPVLYVGQGCRDSSNLLRQFAIKANIPVTTTLHGMGIFDETHPLSLKMIGMHGSVYSNYAIQKADCIIALGSRFDDRTTGEVSKYAPIARKNKKMIHVNIDNSEFGKVIDTDYNVNTDCGNFLLEILPYIRYKKRFVWYRYIDKLKQMHPFRYNKAPDNKIKTQSVIIELNNQIIKRNDVIISMGVGNHMMMACQFIDWKNPKQVIASGSLGVMGCSNGYSIGAQLANKDCIVVSVDGDGSFNMTSNELKTMVEYNIPIKIAVMNDSSLQMVRVWEELFFDKRYTATANNNNPDYVKLAEAYGLEALYCDNYTDLPHIMDKFLNSNKPILCEFKVEKDICLPLVGPGKALDEMILFDDYHSNKNMLLINGEVPS